MGSFLWNSPNPCQVKNCKTMKYPFDSLIENWKFQRLYLHSPSCSDFMAILRIFLAEFEDKIWFGAYVIQGTHKSSKTQIKILVLGEKLNFTFVTNSKTDFSGGQKHERLHFDTKFHIFRSNWESNNFKTWF